MKQKIPLLAALCVLSIAGSTQAGAPTITSVGRDTQSRAYAGLAWTLGAKNPSLLPQVVLGVQSLTVRSDNNVCNGVDLNLRLAPSNGFKFDSARIAYVGGTRDVLGNVGIGYSFASKSFLSTVSAQAAYSRFGLDYEYSTRKALPFVEILTSDRPKKVNPIISNPVC